jgi:hypothetical protein
MAATPRVQVIETAGAGAHPGVFAAWARLVTKLLTEAGVTSLQDSRMMEPGGHAAR